MLQFYTFAQVFSNLHFYTLLAQSFIHKTFMKINSLHLRLIHAWMCTKDHKCKYKQVSTKNRHSFRIARLIHYTVLECEQQEWEEFRGGSPLETDLLQVYVSTCPLCSAHSWTAHIYIAKWNGTRFRIFFFFFPDCDLGRSSSICHPNHCNLWFIFVYVLNSAFNNCSRHMDKRGWSIFIIHRAHVHTPRWHQK